MSKTTAKGIFCLEGDWDNDLREPTTVQPVLELLSKSVKPQVHSIRRDIGTKPEFEHYISKWALKRYRDYPLLYLAFHGTPEKLYFGDYNRHITLDELEELLHGKCHKRIIHFGSCGTMAIHGKRLKRFLKNTGALAVCGYKADVDWLVSTAFEIILLGAFQWNTLTRTGVEAVRKRILREAGGIARDLDFRLVVS